MSIRSQLLFRLIAVSILFVATAAWFGYQDIRQETRELFDAQLSRSARLILSLAQAQHGDSGFSRIQEYLDENGLSVRYIDFESKDDDIQTEHGHIYETKLAFQIWDKEGNLVVKSYNAPLEPMTNKPMAKLENGYSDTTFNEHQWRTFSLPSNNKEYRCITAERIDVRNDLIVKISNDLFYMFIFLIPALALIIYYSIYQGLKPLQLLTSEINQRSGNRLDLISSNDDHTEIATIKNALNQLLTRLKDTLAREQRITSDAAHELRTPLAAIRLHTELAKNAEDTKQKDESLEQVLLGVDRTTHLVDQLLELARLEPDVLAQEFVEVNLSDLVIQESALLSPLALKKDLDISFSEEEASLIKGNEASLRLLIRNLLSNAISYTPNKGKVTINLSRNSETTTLTIEDSGPGISESDRQRVLERFYRTENHETPGCGIGLSIVDRVVKIHGGKLNLLSADNGQGLKAVVEFKTIK
jgi:two-component system sensor histidine kinase QseC